MLTKEEIWTAENLPKREPSGVLVDWERDGSAELAVAGILCFSKSECESTLEGLRGYVKIFFFSEASGSYGILWEKEFADVHYLEAIEKTRLDRGKAGQVFVRFSIVSNMVPVLNVLAFRNGHLQACLDFLTCRGAAGIENLDGDGVQELVTHTVFNPEASTVEGFPWYDVHVWTGFGFQAANSKFPGFYRKLIRDYQVQRDKALAKGASASLLRSYREAIEKAQKLAGERQ